MNTNDHLQSVVPQLVEWVDGAPRLLAACCKTCASYYLPRRDRCANPTCKDSNIQPVYLSKVGTLYSYTRQTFRPPPLFAWNDWQPYVIGVVELAEGLRVMGMIVGADSSTLEIGMTLELTTQRLSNDINGRAICTYAFCPLEAEVT